MIEAVGYALMGFGMGLAGVAIGYLAADAVRGWPVVKGWLRK